MDDATVFFLMIIGVVVAVVVGGAVALKRMNNGRRCSRCGAEYPPAGRFCPHCGQKV